MMCVCVYIYIYIHTHTHIHTIDLNSLTNLIILLFGDSKSMPLFHSVLQHFLFLKCWKTQCLALWILFGRLMYVDNIPTGWYEYWISPFITIQRCYRFAREKYKPPFSTLWTRAVRKFNISSFFLLLTEKKVKAAMCFWGSSGAFPNADNCELWIWRLPGFWIASSLD